MYRNKECLKIFKFKKISNAIIPISYKTLLVELDKMCFETFIKFTMTYDHVIGT